MTAPTPNRLDADIAWHQQQVQACADALAVMATEPESLSLEAETHILMESMSRYQATLEHLLRLKAMTDRFS